MSVTVRDIAKKLNLGKSTVGYVLSGSPVRVSDEVRSMILETARDMGYRPNENARSLAKGKTGVIGIVPFQLQRGALNSPFVRTAVGAIYDRAEDLGRHVLLFTGYSPSDHEGMRVRSFEARVDGIVLISPKIDQEMLSYIAEQELPFAVVAGPQGGAGLRFHADNAAGIRQVVDHLVELGHRRIAVISGPDDDSDGTVRHRAFLDAMARHDLPIAEENMERGDFTDGSGYRAAMRLLKKDGRPTAIVAANDQMAFGVVDAARELGLRIPEELSVTGFDNEELGARLLPPLTTVHYPIAEMAAAALDAVVNVVEGRDPAPTAFDARLIVRASTASPKEDTIHAS